jgi:hypothetical protein
MVDTARLFRPVSLLEEMMDAMASAKFNTLYLHITDDGCWPLEILSCVWFYTSRSPQHQLDHKYMTTPT